MNYYVKQYRLRINGIDKETEYWAFTGCRIAQATIADALKPPKIGSKEWQAEEDYLEQEKRRRDRECDERMNADRYAVLDAKRKREEQEEERLANCPKHQEYLRINATERSDDFELDLEDHYKLAVHESDRYFEVEERKNQDRSEMNQMYEERRRKQRKHRISGLFRPITNLWHYRSRNWLNIWLWWHGFKYDLVLWAIVGAVGLVALFIIITPIFVFNPDLFNWVMDLILGPADSGIIEDHWSWID